MPTIREFFEWEAADTLDRLRATANGLDASAAEPAELHRLARRLRGSAQMARDERVTRVAAGLEAAGRALAEGRMAWSGEAAGAVRAALEAAGTLVRAEDPAAGDALTDSALARLEGLGVDLGEGRAAARESASGAAEFLAFAAREVDGILGEIDRVLLAADPRDHGPLTAVLRRQRPLMGAARLDSTPILGETLTAMDEISRMIVRLGAPVKSEWLDVYRAAHDVLEAAAERLHRGEEPARVPALSRLRTLREELADRYGAAEEPQAPPIFAPGEEGAHEPEAAATSPEAPDASPDAAGVPAEGASAPAPPPATEPVPVEAFFYAGARALRRALELRGTLEGATTADPAAREAVQELFDLIRMALA